MVYSQGVVAKLSSDDRRRVCVYVHGHYITRMYVRGGSVVVLGRA